MEDASALATSRQRKQYYSVTDAVWGCRQIGGSAKLVALRLARNWPRIFPSIAFLAAETGLSERTVQVAIRELEAQEVIATTRRRGTSSRYAFPNVSIPELGKFAGDGGSGGGGAESAPPGGGQNLRTPSAESAHPPPQILHPNSEDLTLEPKGRGGARARERGKPRTPRPHCLVFHTTLHGWELSAELRSFALQLGLKPAALDRRLRRLRLVRIGGRSGVTDRDGYIRTCIEEWAEWEAERAANAHCGAGKGLSSSDRGLRGGWQPTEKMKRFAAKHQIDIDSLAEAFVRGGEAAQRGNGVDADQAFAKRLSIAARERSSRGVAA